MIQSEDYNIYENCKFGIGPHIHCLRITLGLDRNGDVIAETNDFINLKYSAAYSEYIQQYRQVLSNAQPNHTIPEQSVLLVPTYTYGTVHGFSGFYSMLLKYVKHANKLGEHTITVFDNCCPAYIDILNYFRKKGILQSTKIQTISVSQITLFSKCILFKNTLHSFVENLEETLAIKSFFASLEIPPPVIIQKRICILKNSSSLNNTHLGVLSINTATSFADKNDLTLLEPGTITEENLYSILNNCETIVISWSSAFKNLVYLSKNCKYVYILIVGNEFKYEYEYLKSRNMLPSIYLNTETEFFYMEVSDESLLSLKVL